jgi:hypothetical protein
LITWNRYRWLDRAHPSLSSGRGAQVFLVAVDPLRRLIPCRGDAIQRLADNGVIR